jgi:hypothetical protein
MDGAHNVKGLHGIGGPRFVLAQVARRHDDRRS